MSTPSPESQKKWAKIIAKAWSDPVFKAKLLKNPQAVLTEQGLNFSMLPKGARVEMHENTNMAIHLVLPCKPNRALSEEELMKIAAASCGSPGGDYGTHDAGLRR